MALTGIALQLKPEHRAIQNPSLIHFFPSSTPDSNVEDQNTPSSSPSQSQPQSQSQSSFSSYFSDVKASLKHQQSPQQQHQQQPSKYSVSSAQTPSKVASLEEIRKNLSEFRCRSAGGQVVVVISVSSDVSTHLIPGALQVKCDIKRRKFHNEVKWNVWND
ncbi:hypothetical protein CsSME_00052565 [Camellia sinensis var. sinensis]